MPVDWSKIEFPTDEFLDALPVNALVDVEWSGGNRGIYRVVKDKWGYSYAVNSKYYNEDSSVKEDMQWMAESMFYYNRLWSQDVWNCKVINY